MSSFSMLQYIGMSSAEVKIILAGEFGTLSIVCAVLSGLAFGLFANPPASMPPGPKFAYGVITAGGIFANIAIFTFTTLLRRTMSVLGRDDDTDSTSLSLWFISNFATYAMLATLVLYNLSACCLLIVSRAIQH